LYLGVARIKNWGWPKWTCEVNDQFNMVLLPRDAMRKRGHCCRPVSVRLSVTLVHCIHPAADIVKLILRSSSPITLVFWPQRRYPIPRRTENPFRGAQNTRWWEKLRFSTKIVVYLGNGTK